MNIFLQKADINDIPMLISIEQRVSGARTYSPMLSKEEWCESLQKNTTYFIKNDTEIVGEISYEMKDGSHAHIDGLVVVPEFQNQGIGRKAMEILLDILKDISRIDLVTHPDNTHAVALYTSLGFRSASKIENYFGDGEPRVTMVLQK